MMYGWCPLLLLQVLDGGGVCPAEDSLGAPGWAYIEDLMTGRIAFEDALMEPEELVSWLQEQQSALITPPAAQAPSPAGAAAAATAATAGDRHMLMSSADFEHFDVESTNELLRSVFQEMHRLMAANEFDDASPS